MLNLSLAASVLASLMAPGISVAGDAAIAVNGHDEAREDIKVLTADARADFEFERDHRAATAGRILARAGEIRWAKYAIDRGAQTVTAQVKMADLPKAEGRVESTFALAGIRGDASVLVTAERGDASAEGSLWGAGDLLAGLGQAQCSADIAVNARRDVVTLEAPLSCFDDLGDEIRFEVAASATIEGTGTVWDQTRPTRYFDTSFKAEGTGSEDLEH